MLLNKVENIEKVERKPSYLTRFLWWCAGVDSELMKQCTHEWAKYASMGATILFTGMFASIAGGYALYTVFRDGTITEIDTTALYYAIAFGIFWGLVIFNLDRYIITTFKKSASENIFVGFCKDFLHAIPRIILAIIIAITISKPIELKLFEKRLAQEIIDNEQITKMNNAETYHKIYDIDGQNREIQAADSTKAKYAEEKKNKPENIIELERELDEKTNNKKQLEVEQSNALTERKKVWNNSDNFNLEYDSAGVALPKKYVDLKKVAREEYDKWNTTYRNKGKEITRINKEISNLKAEIETKKREHEAHYTKLINETEEIIKGLEENLAKSENSKAIEIAKADSIARIAYTNNFVTQLEALSSLQRADLEGLDPNNQRDLLVIKEREDEARTFAMISWAITLLFLCIELAPMLAKLITSRGVYDELIEAEEYKHTQKYKIQKEKLQIDYEGEIRTHNEEKQIYYAANIEANKKIMNQIASVQIELLESAIEEWRKEELAKIKANPSQYIKSNT